MKRWLLFILSFSFTLGTSFAVSSDGKESVTVTETSQYSSVAGRVDFGFVKAVGTNTVWVRLGESIAATNAAMPLPAGDSFTIDREDGISGFSVITVTGVTSEITYGLYTKD